MTDEERARAPAKRRKAKPLKVVLHPSLFQGDRLTRVLVILERMLADGPADD